MVGSTASVGEVFVPGGLPRITYNPRESLKLEERVSDYVNERHKVLSVSGPKREMTGRVEQLEIEFWSADELRGIAEGGFEALNVTADAAVVDRLTEESFSSPHLMQEFCLQLCKLYEIRATQTETARLEAPEWVEFFSSRASAASKTAFELLAQGPRQRADRIERVLDDGTTTDIYGAVLAAIAATGPLTAVSYTDLRASLRDIMESPPQTQEVTRVLERMSEIARDRIEGEPVVDYDSERSTLFISDPFFAYYLRWGTDPPLAAVREHALRRRG